MRSILKVLFCASILLTVAVGCVETAHVYNLPHWRSHIAKIFDATHNFHVSVDRIVFGVDNYEELETTKTIYRLD